MTKARDLADRTAADLTAVTAGTGISITNGTGPIPTVTNTVATGFDAKGDLIIGTGADTFTTLTVGSTANFVLTVDSATTSGLKWAAVASGGVELISETVASTASSLNLTGIPQTYDHLMLTWHGIQHSDSASGFRIRFENDSGSNYAAYHNAYYETPNSSTTPNWSVSGSTYTDISGTRAFGYGCSSGTVALQAQGRIIIYNYASTTRRKFYELQYGYQRQDNVRYEGISNLMGTYLSNTAIDEINIVRTDGTGTFTNSTNTSIRLYGIA